MFMGILKTSERSETWNKGSMGHFFLQFLCWDFFMILTRQITPPVVPGISNLEICLKMTAVILRMSVKNEIPS